MGTDLTRRAMIRQRLRRRTLIGTAVTAWLFAGCSVGPEYRRPEVATPQAWSPGGERAFEPELASRAVARPFDGRRWWSVFNDPVLDRLVQAAMAQNLDLQTAALRIATARAQRDSATGDRWPDVEATGVAGRARVSQNGVTQNLGGSGASGPTGGAANGGATGGSGAQTPTAFNLFQAGFDATWELDLFGGVRRNIEAAEADLRSAEEARRDSLVSLTAEIARNWLTLRGAQRQREIALADIETQNRLGRLVESRNRVGFTGSADVVAQRSQIASARGQLPPIEQSIAQSGNRLALLLALPPGGVAQIVGDSSFPPPLPPEVPVGLPGELLRRRPDIRQSEADLAAATARVGVATAALFPSVRLGLSGGLQASRASDLFDWSSRFLLGGTQLSIPIFEGGRLRAQVRVADLQAQQAVLSYRQTVLSAFHDVDNALVAYAAEQRRAAFQLRQVEAAQRSRALAAERYRTGLAAFIEVLDAERQAHQAELALADSTVNASTDLVALFKALGGGWSDDDPSVASR